MDRPTVLLAGFALTAIVVGGSLSLTRAQEPRGAAETSPRVVEAPVPTPLDLPPPPRQAEACRAEVRRAPRSAERGLALLASETEAGPGAILGTVLDSSGYPVAGASVDVWSPTRGLSHELETDRAGGFVLRNLPYGTWRVRVRAAGPAVKDEVVAITPEQAESRVELRLGGTGRVCVRVSRDSYPTRDARVLLSAMHQGLPLEARTDSSGRARFEEVPAGVRFVRVLVDDPTGARPPVIERIEVATEAETELDVVLPIGFPLELAGRVLVNDRAVVAGCVVATRAPDDTEAVSAPARTSIDAEGNYRFSPLPPGVYELEVFYPVSETEIRRFVVEHELEGITSSRRDIDVEVGGFSGRLSDRWTGESLRGCVLGLEVLRDESWVTLWPPRDGPLVTDAEGRYRAPGLLVGTYRVVWTDESRDEVLAESEPAQLSPGEERVGVDLYGSRPEAAPVLDREDPLRQWGVGVAR